jgi:hypothetical protein
VATLVDPHLPALQGTKQGTESLGEISTYTNDRRHLNLGAGDSQIVDTGRVHGHTPEIF